jgi:hypothetical protein
VRESVQTAIAKLPRTLKAPADLDSYFYFFDTYVFHYIATCAEKEMRGRREVNLFIRYGTHIISQLVLGGMREVKIIVDGQSNMTKSEIEFAASAKLSYISANPGVNSI